MRHDQSATRRTRHHGAVLWQRDLQRKYLEHLCSDGDSKFIGGDHLFTVVVIAAVLVFAVVRRLVPLGCSATNPERVQYVMHCGTE